MLLRKEERIYVVTMLFFLSIITLIASDFVGALDAPFIQMKTNVAVILYIAGVACFLLGFGYVLIILLQKFKSRKK